MKDYCDLSIKKSTVKDMVSLLHGVICVMNRFHQSAQSQAIYEMFITVHYRHWNKKLLFNFIADLMILTNDNSSYHKMLYHVRNQVQNIKE
jgi:hypothetical protein